MIPLGFKAVAGAGEVRKNGREAVSSTTGCVPRENKSHPLLRRPYADEVGRGFRSGGGGEGSGGVGEGRSG